MLIDWFTVAAQAVNFLILVWLLKRFLYRPILAAIDEREKRIAAQIQDAEKKKAEALQEQADFRRKNEEFETQRSALLLEATGAAKTEREKLLETARHDAGELRDKLEKSLYDDLGHLDQKIGSLVQQEVFSVTRKALTDLAGANLEERMTAVFIQHLHDLPDPQRAELLASLHASSNPALVRSAFELAPPERASIEGAVKKLFGEETRIEFETRPDLVGGIELAANGHKIAWSIDGYLTALTHSVKALLEPTSETVAVSPKVVPHAA